MVFGISSKIIIAQAAVIVIGGGIAWMWFNYTNKVIDNLKETRARLEMSIKTQNATIEAQKNASLKQNEEFVKLQQSLSNAEIKQRDLEQKLRRKNLELMARNDSRKLEQQINQSNTDLWKSIEILTGSKEKTKDSKSTVDPNVQPPPKLPQKKE